MIGLGGVGLSCVMGAAIAGAGRIVAVDRVPASSTSRGRSARRTGILAGPDAAATIAAIRDATEGGPDTCFEAIGLPATIERAIACLPTGGTAVLVGMTPFGVRASFEPFPFVDGGRRILGSNYGPRPVHDFPRYAGAPPRREVARGPARRPGRIGLDGLEDAFAAMRRGEGVRTMIGLGSDARSQLTSATEPRGASTPWDHPRLFGPSAAAWSPAARLPDRRQDWLHP